jgi:hypothetical protein
MFRVTENISGELKDYITTISRDYCPYLKKSMGNNYVSFTDYDLTTYPNFEEIAFSLALIHAEGLRKFKSNTQLKAENILLCENLVFYTSSNSIIDDTMFFQWLHWALKSIYTNKGLLFGKFWPHEVSKAKSGAFIPFPPDKILSIRSTVGKQDAHFFDITPQLIDQHSSCKDIGDSISKDFSEEISSKLHSLLKKTDIEVNDKEAIFNVSVQMAELYPLRNILTYKAIVELQTIT